MLDMLCSPLFGFASRLSWIAWHGGLTLSAVLLVVTGLSSDARLLIVAFVPLTLGVLLSIGLEAYSRTIFVAPEYGGLHLPSGFLTLFTFLTMWILSGTGMMRPPSFMASAPLMFGWSMLFWQAWSVLADMVAGILDEGW